MLTVRGRMGPSKPEKSSLLTSHPPAMFLLRAEERDARIVSMCQLKEHTVNNVILTKYECVCGNIVNVHIYFSKPRNYSTSVSSVCCFKYFMSFLPTAGTFGFIKALFSSVQRNKIDFHWLNMLITPGVQTCNMLGQYLSCEDDTMKHHFSLWEM